MTESASSSKDASKLRRSAKDERASKKQKREPATFKYPASLVEFAIGPTKFIVHKELVCKHSQTLEKALNSTFKDEVETYKLEDTSEDAVRLLMQWFYYQELNLLQTSVNAINKNQTVDLYLEDMSLVELWVLANWLEMTTLQNACIDAIHKIFQVAGEEITTGKTFEYIYTHTDDCDNKLRRYVVDLCVRYARESFASECEDALPWQMLFEMTDAFISASRAAAAGVRREFKISDYYVEETQI